MSKLRKVALSQPTITSTYAGEFAGEYIASAILSAPTLEAGAVTIMPNVKYKSVLKTLTNTLEITNATCDFDDTASVSLNEKVIVMDEKQINLTLCKTPFVSDWEAVQMGYSAFDNIPTKFSDFLIGNILAQVAAKTEIYLWNLTDGFPYLLADDGANVITYGAVTTANVITKMGTLVDGLPNAVYNKDGLKMFVSIDVAKKYIRALGGFATNIGANGYNNEGTQWFTAGGALSYEGIPIFVANGAVDNTMVLTTTSNLYFGTGLMSDYNEVKLLDMADLDGSKNVRFVMRWTQGIQVGFGSDAVVHANFA